MTEYSAERPQIHWVKPEGDPNQHATLDRPPRGGGPVEPLGGHEPVESPPVADPREFQMAHNRPFCEECFTAYLKLPTALPVWKH
ncbi:hypothetical protein CDG81_17315 [Actinopolyspora erythraea]|uniref:Uncharacterized protein n=2 Tax=Actinopolyspora TaxID=1849 RepID=A0A099D0W0_9ACTN|nr:MULTISPECIES: hypothetical protein [Actinopolyspora]ASU81218.1 hypothetical protein CDG81_17315 [Actinopolyspora erythraea]KGI79546.1 hypothetical protein IL38_22780 [Actinopolyspora erythraea]SDP83766.1 hypothetical protein SAMN04487905_11047 [Actinopolyspora xinjiangensis]